MKNLKRYLIIFIFVIGCMFIYKTIPMDCLIDWRFVFAMTMGSIGQCLNLSLKGD